MSNICDVGVDPRCWYPAVRSDELRCGGRCQVRFLGRSYLVYRDVHGEVHCLDNACAHRRVALHEGEVQGCRIVCPYHGWEYDPDGRLAKVPYWAADKELPHLRVAAYPTTERSGLVWFIPEPTDELPPPPPDTSAWEKRDFFSFRLDRVFPNHYGIGLVNGMDYFHFHLHRKYQPWSDIELVSMETNEDAVVGEYTVTTGRTRPERVLRTLLGADPRVASVTSTLRVRYDYPHHIADLGDGMTVWVFFRPESRDSVSVYITMYVVARGLQRRVRQVFEPAFRRFVLGRIQDQDAWIGTIEQTAWETRPDEPRCELNPVAAAAERLLRGRWRRYLDEVPHRRHWPAVDSADSATDPEPTNSSSAGEFPPSRVDAGLLLDQRGPQ